MNANNHFSLENMQKQPDINSLKYYHKNPRIISEKQYGDLKQWLDELGDLSGLVHELNTDEIIGGNQRSRVFKEGGAEIVLMEKFDPPTKTGTVGLGYVILRGEKYAYRQVRWNEKQSEQANIVANKAGGVFDWDILANQFDSDKLMEWGFSAEELGMESTKLGETGGDDTIPDIVSVKSITVKGDIYEIETKPCTLRLMCGDSLDVLAVKNLMNGVKADMAFTDPPYNVNLNAGDESREIENDKMSREDFRKFLTDAMVSVSMALKDGAMTYVFMSDRELGTLLGVMADSGFHWSSTIVWNKDRFVLGRGDYHSKKEPIWYGWKEGEARLCPVEDRKQSDVWDFDRPEKSEEHPTMKPVSLIVRAIENSTKARNSVVDLFNGSGSTGIACIKVGRDYYGMETETRYCDVTIRRIVDFCKENKIEFCIKRNGTDFDWPQLYEASNQEHKQHPAARN